MKKIIYILLIGIFTLGCSKSSDSEALSNSKMGFKVNGKQRTVLDGGIKAGFTETTFMDNTIGTLSIYGSFGNIFKGKNFGGLLFGVSSIGESIDLKKDITWTKGNIQENIKITCSYVEDFYSDDVDLVEANYIDGNFTIKITSYHEAKQTISGKFEFTLYDDVLNKEFKVTDGFFNEIELESKND